MFEPIWVAFDSSFCGHFSFPHAFARANPATFRALHYGLHSFSIFPIFPPLWRVPPFPPLLCVLRWEHTLAHGRTCAHTAGNFSMLKILNHAQPHASQRPRSSLPFARTQIQTDAATYTTARYNIRLLCSARMEYFSGISFIRQSFRHVGVFFFLGNCYENVRMKETKREEER